MKDVLDAMMRDPTPVAHSASGGNRLRTWARTMRQAWTQMVGIPDYDRYLAHHAAHHPEEPVLSRGEFFAQAIDRRYSRSGPRCC